FIPVGNVAGDRRGDGDLGSLHARRRLLTRGSECKEETGAVECVVPHLGDPGTSAFARGIRKWYRSVTSTMLPTSNTRVKGFCYRSVTCTSTRCPGFPKEEVHVDDQNADLATSRTNSRPGRRSLSSPGNSRRWRRGDRRGCRHEQDDVVSALPVKGRADRGVGARRRRADRQDLGW